MIRKGILLVIGGFGCLILSFSVSNVYTAPIALSEASIDWSTFTCSGVNINWLYNESYSEAYAEDDNDFADDDDYVENWGNTDALAFVAHARGEGWTTTDIVAEKTWARWNGYSDASAELYGEFKALETGILTVSVEYFLSQDLSTEDDNEDAYGYSLAGLELSNGSTYSYDDVEFENEVGGGDVLSYSDAGTLEVILAFNQGDFGYIAAGVYNESEVWSDNPDTSVVPEPATILLLGSGLLGLLGLGVRKRKNISTCDLVTW